jgi:hypothetical protein
MKHSLVNRRSVARIGIVSGITFLVAAAALVLVALLRPGSAAPASTALPVASAPATSPPVTEVPPSPTPEVGLTDASIVASVNGYTITWSHLETATALNQVLSELAGQGSLGGEETLQRLIRQEIVLQGAPLEVEPGDAEVADYIGRMQEAWEVDEQAMQLELAAAGVSWDFLEGTIHRLLSVQAAVESVESEGKNISEWLAAREAEADVRISEDLSRLPAPGVERTDETRTTEVDTEVEQPSPTVTRFVPPEVPDVAPDFTLDQAGGGTFSLYDQLEEGPVVLVFFEKCG